MFEDPTYVNEKEGCCDKEDWFDWTDDLSTLDGLSEFDTEQFQIELFPHPAGIDIDMDLEF